MVLLSVCNRFGLSVSFVLSCVGTNADIMKVGGYKLSALEIESVLLQVNIPTLDIISKRTALKELADT